MKQELPNTFYPFPSVIAIFVGALILSLIPLYNGYPLVYSDTGTYIHSGFSKTVPMDRPITYGLFLYYSSLKMSTWLVVIIQNFLTSFVLFRVVRLFTKSQKGYFSFYGIISFLTFFTAIGWYSGQLMPDFLAPIMILSLVLLWKEKQQKPLNLILLSLIFLFSVLVHFSHLLIASMLITIVTSLHFLRPQLITVKRWLFAPLLIILGWLILPTMNYMIDDEFKISKGSHVFFISHLNDTGLLKTILDNYCPTDEFSDVKLCDYKDSLPHDAASFIWSTDILENTGGWEGSKKEYDKIIRLSFTQPRYLLNNISKSFLYGMIQLTKNKIGEGLSPYTEHSAPYGQIHWRFNHEVNNYMMSRQNKYNGFELDLKLLNQVHLFILILSFLACIYLFTNRRWSKLSKNAQFLLLFIIAGILINSMVTAGLNTPYDRYQARVVWLLPFALLLLLVHHRKELKRWTFRKLNQLRN